MDKQLKLWDDLNSNNSVTEVQKYIEQVINIRGFSNQSIEKAMLLLTEEVGELAKAIRKNETDMAIDKEKLINYDTIESEIADVFIVLNTICNKLNINLFKAVKEKEQKNISRNWSKDKNKNNNYENI